jgi:transcriptional regulator with XRE-family HTH domain
LVLVFFELCTKIHKKFPKVNQWSSIVNLGSRLKSERLRLGLSQAEFASLGGVGKSSQIHYESGDRTPDSNYLIALSSHGVDVSYVLLGTTAGSAPAPTVDTELLTQIIEAVDAWSNERERPITSAVKAELIALFFEQFSRTGRFEPAIMARHLRLVG